jgi:hypothetical protein
MTEPKVPKEPNVEDLEVARARLVTQMLAPQSVESLVKLRRELRQSTLNSSTCGRRERPAPDRDKSTVQ